MPDDLTVTFAVALAALTGLDDRLGVAVSGGPDSMALLHLAQNAAPGRIEAATVDHGLRPEAAEEAAMVAGWCADHGIVHAVLRPASPIEGSVQAAARVARYALLEGWRAARGFDWLLTAHHADDQLETLLMRLNRGSGVGGLAGVRARRGRVLRPLLGARKADLVAYADALGIPYAHDPSNDDARFDRARLRRALANADFLDAAAASRSAAALAEADAALEWSVDRLYAAHVTGENAALTLADTDLPQEYLHRLLRRMVVAVAPDAPAPRGEQIAQAIIQLSCGKRISIGACVATGGRQWTVRRSPSRRS